MAMHVSQRNKRLALIKRVAHRLDGRVYAPPGVARKIAGNTQNWVDYWDGRELREVAKWSTPDESLLDEVDPDKPFTVEDN